MFSSGLTAANLTPAQLSGVACVECLSETADMVPVGHVDGVQVFAHPSCAAQSTDETSAVLVTGPCSTPAECDDLTAFAYDVTDQLGFRTVVATSDTVDVREFAALVVYGPSLSDPMSTVGTAMVLEAEAALYDVPVIVAQPVSDFATCDACGQRQTIATVRNGHGEVFCVDCTGDAPGCAQCLADEVTEPVYVDGAWVPMCSSNCAGIGKALNPSPWNAMAGAEASRLLVGMAA
ncbi:hypothetical protein ACIQM0_38540 [Streptomyces sp. NPDC091387]|uniref:hypothetical protein n=1 Tax=Streptomyces sp. NPDC091387 TaxID=3365998 RepID=UPI00382269D1